MASKKFLNEARRAALILEARAGLIPESHWLEEEVIARIKCTARLGRVVKSRARLLARGSDALAISENPRLFNPQVRELLQVDSIH